MPEEFDELNGRLAREFERRDRNSQRSPVPTELITRPAEEAPRIPVETAATQPPSRKDVETDQMGMINRLRLRNAESAHQLERARLVYRTEMQLITHQSEAAIRESRAFWDAKSVEVAESIKTYVQSTIRALEIDRLDSRNADLTRAYEAAAAALEKARQTKLPEVLKDRLIKDILDNFERTLGRIQHDTIVSKYDLD